MPLFTELAIVIVIAVLAGFVAHLLRQPPIIGFIAAGALIGFFEYVGETHTTLIEGLSSVGVALLLFLVGLEMDFGKLKHVTLPSVLVGVGQILFTFGVGFVIVSALGFSTVVSFYIAIAITFSSTILVVKLLSEKGDLNSLYGRIVIGFLLVQDFAAILLLIFISGLQGGGNVGAHLATTFLTGAGFIILTVLAYKFLPRFLDLIGRSQEMLYLFGIAWALGISALSASFGLSVEVGGFLAGLALASSSEHFQIASRLRPLRDFFIILFFVGLGIQALEGGVAVSLMPAILLSLFILVGNPLIVIALMGALGYKARTSFLSSLTVAQISEFSFIIIALGHRFGDLDSSHVSLVTLVGMITIFVSSYFIIHGNRLYDALRPLAKKFEFRRKLVEETPEAAGLSNHVVLVGVHRMGEQILRALSNTGRDFVAVDFDPRVVKKVRDIEIPIVFGDISDVEIQDGVGLEKAETVISTVPNFDDNVSIAAIVREENKKAKLVLTAENEWQARELYKEGADYVLVPHFIGGREIADVISEDSGLAGLSRLKDRDTKLLER